MANSTLDIANSSESTLTEEPQIFGTFSNFSSADPHLNSSVFGIRRTLLASEALNGTSSSTSSKESLMLRNLRAFISGLKTNGGAGAASATDDIPVLVHPVLRDFGQDFSTKDLKLNWSLEDIRDLNKLLEPDENELFTVKNVSIVALYAFIGVVSVIGNLLVVQLVIRSRRLHTLTHALLANLAVADLLMATLNIPLTAVRVIMPEWPLGSFLCHFIPLVQVTSVYVTSITMAVIAVDRYQVIMNPLGRRMKKKQGIYLVLVVWTVASLLSLPYAIYHKVVPVLTVRVVNRCQANFPSMSARRWLTVTTLLAQYAAPLLFTTVSYVSIMRKLGLRSTTSIVFVFTTQGSTTPRQVAAQSKAKRTTIKMLVLTVVFFAVCWFPINAYHLLTHFHVFPPNSTAILTCHLIAMSSTCYNPFIYCWLNEHFRREAKKWLCCFCHKRPTQRHGPSATLQINDDAAGRSAGVPQPPGTSSPFASGRSSSKNFRYQHQFSPLVVASSKRNKKQRSADYAPPTSSNSIFRAESSRNCSSSAGNVVETVGAFKQKKIPVPAPIARLLNRKKSSAATGTNSKAIELEVRETIGDLDLVNVADIPTVDGLDYSAPSVAATSELFAMEPENSRKNSVSCFPLKKVRSSRECRV